MSTNSSIALEFADGSVSQVYCHYDGYLKGVGADLLVGYTDPFALQELIDGGDMRSVGDYFAKRGDPWDLVAPRRFQNFDEFDSEGLNEEYNYILRPVAGKGVWFVRCYATDGEWVELEKVMHTETV